MVKLSFCQSDTSEIKKTGDNFLTLETNRNEALMNTLERSTKRFECQRNLFEMVKNIDDEIFEKDNDL